MEDIYTYMYIYKINAINHVTMSTIHMFAIYYWMNMVATLHKYVPLHCCSSAPTEPILVQTELKHLVSDTYGHKVIGINEKKICGYQMQTKNAMINK